ncbi:MAG: hypothetical protein ATN36_06390 [Epulopiscium sp. Nele67-Bin005]|nr:MAG: hypothetical protein ATN36_06390 [Epulopiscium sp. Nele67-Bin005]
MRILRVTGKSEGQLQEQIKKDYGEDVIVISSQEEKKSGLLGLFNKSQWCITIALEDEEPSYHKEDEEQLIENDLTGWDDLLNPVQKNEIEVLTTQKEDKISNDISSPKEFLRASLLEEGIQPEIIDEIISKTTSDDVREISKSLYGTLTQLMPKFNHNLPQVNFFIGPTGVGKTTTIAKLTAMKVLQEKKKVVLLTADTYRIAAVEQLRTYAEILGVPIETIYNEQDVITYIEKWKDADHIFIDTAGRSHKNLEQLDELKRLLAWPKERQIFLVLNISTSYRDIKNIIKIYENVAKDFSLIVTKLDETDAIGNLMNITYCTKKPIAFMTNGQAVPEDIEKFESLQYVKLLIGRVKYE